MSTDSYIPGTCNIGKGEIRRRQLVALIGLALSVTSLVGFVATGAAPTVRLGIFLPLAVFAIGFVQSRRKFCLAYGFMGTFNFGKLGQLSKVSSKEAQAADRKTALTILAQSLGLAALLTAIVYILPL
jgi:fatty acid desaturase